MTVKVTFVIGEGGETMVDNFDVTLSEFIDKASVWGISLDDIVKIEVV